MGLEPTVALVVIMLALACIPRFSVKARIVMSLFATSAVGWYRMGHLRTWMYLPLAEPVALPQKALAELTFVAVGGLFFAIAARYLGRYLEGDDSRASTRDIDHKDMPFVAIAFIALSGMFWFAGTPRQFSLIAYIGCVPAFIVWVRLIRRSKSGKRSKSVDGRPS